MANGNITISDEFRYNGGTTNPMDSLCLIAMKDPALTNAPSGNIYLGDASYGTGGDVHAMLYAENDFKDNNLDTTGQSDLNIFGNMSAGNQVNLFRTTGSKRTKLDVTLDRRIQEGTVTAPGVPPAVSGQRGIFVSHEWDLVKGTWNCQSRLK